jgi:hypothetical protein
MREVFPARSGVAGTPLGRAARALHAAARTALAALTALGLAGCDLFEADRPFVRKPAVLSPETDMFSANALRHYSWTEGLLRGKKDSTLRVGSLSATRTGDSIAGGDTLVRVSFSSTPGAAAEAVQLGLNPARLILDSVHGLDAGPAIGFPAAPALGWRLDTTLGDLRFVRHLTKTQVLRSLGKDVECWVFAESTYWGGHRVATGTYWMGATGLVRHRREWPEWQPSGGEVAGTLWREIKPLKSGT